MLTDCYDVRKLDVAVYIRIGSIQLLPGILPGILHIKKNLPIKIS